MRTFAVSFFDQSYFQPKRITNMADKNSFWNSNYIGLTLKNLFKAAIVVVILIVGVMVFIHFETKHGKTRTVPELKGLQVDKAISLLQDNNLTAEVVDSLYLRDQPLGAIIEQNPAPNSVVKPNRRIYLIINSQTIQQKNVPNVIDMSLRQAEAMLMSNGFSIEKVEYVSSAYKDLVLEIKHNGKNISQGSKLSDGSAITIVAGSGFGSIDSNFPNVVGMDINSAITIINSYNYTLGTVHYETPPNGNELEYIVYKQFPTNEQDSINQIDIWLSINQAVIDRELNSPERGIKNKPKQTKKQQKIEDIEEFF